MKFVKKSVIVVLLLAAAVTLLSSCRAPDTVSSGTKYTLALITELFPDANGADYNTRAEFAIKSEATVSGNAWAALKDNKKSDDAVKYYIPASVTGSEKETYSEAFTKAGVKQLELAAAGGAEIILLSSDDFSGVYAKAKESPKKYTQCFVLITVPGSEFAESGNLNTKTTAVVLDAAQFGYLFGYYAVKNGYKAPGYIGADNNASRAFVKGFEEGVKAAGNAEASAHHYLTSSGPVESIIKSNLDKLSAESDILIGDELTASYVAASGKKYASIYKDDSAVFSVTVNPEVLKAKISDAVKNVKNINAGTVVKVSAADGLFVYSGSENLVDVPDIAVSAAASDAQ